MKERELENFTLKSWLGKIWNEHRRGVPQFGQNAVLARCMQHHSKWWGYWNSLVTGELENEGLQNAIVHICNDATVISQLESGNPPHVKNLWEISERTGVNEFAIIHTIGVALSEEIAHAKETGEAFNDTRYAEMASKYARELLARPDNGKKRQEAARQS